MNLHRDTMQCANNATFFFFLVSPITEFTLCSRQEEERTEERVAISRANTFCFKRCLH